MAQPNISYDNVQPQDTYWYGDNRYENLTDDELVECFKPHEWEQICKSEEEMLKALRELGNRYAKEQGIDEMPSMVKETDPSLCGGYYAVGNVIKINLEVAAENPIGAMDTVAHEENHAFQIQCIKQENGKYTEGERALLKAQNEAYIRNGPEYWSQSLEADSNNAGLRFVLQHKDKFLNFPEFDTYIKERSSYYHNVVDCYEESPESITLSEYVQILKAQSWGGITQEEADNARKCLQEGNNSIRLEGIELRDQVREIQYKLEQQNAYQQDDGLDFLNHENEEAAEEQQNVQEETIEVLNVEENQTTNEYGM